MKGGDLMAKIPQEQREAIRRQALARIEKASRVRELATVTARMNGVEWPVRIKICADEYFYVAGRDTGFEVYITETHAGYLVSVHNHFRCGHVPPKCNYHDIMNYVGFENVVDAVTLATGINYIVDTWLVKPHPAITS